MKTPLNLWNFEGYEMGTFDEIGLKLLNLPIKLMGNMIYKIIMTWSQITPTALWNC